MASESPISVKAISRDQDSSKFSIINHHLTIVMKLTLAFALVLMTAVDAGLVQSYRQGGNFAYAFNTQQHQPVPLMYNLVPASQPIYYANPKGWLGYSGKPYYTYRELPDNDEVFRTGEQNESKWFLSNPVNTAHAIAATSDFPVITASASGVSTSNGIAASAVSASNGISASAISTPIHGVIISGSAPNAIFQYPLLRLFHRMFNRPFSLISRPNRPLSSIPSFSPIFGDRDTIVINAIR